MFTGGSSKLAVSEPQFSKLEVLVNLGLTPVQARLYLALVESKATKISAISKISRVARPDTYRNLSRIQQLGLVEKIIKRPVEYRAISMNEGLLLLLERKTDEFKKVRAETQMLFDAAKTKKTNKCAHANQTEYHQFVLIPRRIAIKKIRTAFEKAQLSLDFVLCWKKLSHAITNTFAESMEIVWAKNVKIRFIADRPLESKTAKQLIALCKKKPSCQIRFTRHHPETNFLICDKKEMFVLTRPKTSFLRTPALWSNNSSLIGMAQYYFETIWSAR
jgi:sugar-specific transcriptional regulator TrmB